MYRRSAMPEVGIAELRRTLKDWVDRVRAGEDVIVTERGKAVARLSAVDATPMLERLVAEGRVSRPRGRVRPRVRGAKRIRAHGSVSSLVVEERSTAR
jgi:prevent-host-death family protein